MRLPLATVYRAFPELDRFTDDECRRLIYRAQLRGMEGPSDGCVMTALLIAGGVVIFGVAGSMIWASLDGTRLHRIALRSDLLNSAGPVLLLLGIVFSGVSGLVVRDRSLRRLLREQIGRTTCPGCRASLLGCDRSADSLRCGGCGRVYKFGELGLESEDLGPALVVLRADTRCRACEYVIAGLPIDRGFVTCPECGERTPVVENGPPLWSGGEA